MSLITKLTKKYTSPNIKIEYIAEDIVTYSIQKAKLTPEELVEETKNQSFSEKYPDGLPKIVLELIDYTKFGAMLKQERLLPPSYDKTPYSISIVLVGDIPRLKLVFKSKTSESYRKIAIYRYDVSCAKNNEVAFYSNFLMQEQWRKFAEYVMEYWESSFRFEVMK